ncbi:hypothetical protein V5O48_013883 [Marasmius crinis-equi]|uniref:Uncharacterized protein n=1 Tax=Marasmius crinis-equi TaxID=585013 RepID=A0ABR3EYU6_9AGAR
MAPQMRVHDPAKAGSWFQRCRTLRGPSCQVPLEVKSGIGHDHMRLPPFDKLYAVREELRETPRAPKPVAEDVEHPRTQFQPAHPGTPNYSKSSIRSTTKATSCTSSYRRSSVKVNSRASIHSRLPNEGYTSSSRSSRPRHSSPLHSSSPLLGPSTLTSSPASSVLDLTLEDDELLTSLPLLGPASLSPASSVIDLTLDDDDSHTELRTIKFWLEGKAPVIVQLNADNGWVTLAKHKMILAEYGVEKTPMEWWDKASARWTYFFWSERLCAPTTDVINIRAVGVAVPVEEL